ncbi:MAG: Gfo/Idh/MocA family oxidoreductase, partial [Alphaproteobacteria bacterium]
LAGFLIGSPPVRVSATSVRSEDRRSVAEDSIVVTLEHGDGSLSTIQYLAHGSTRLPKERCEVHADGGTAILDNFRRTTFHGVSRRDVGGAQDKGFDGEIAAFVKAVRDGGGWPIPWQDLVRTTRVTVAILESLREGRPVPIS